MECGRATHHCPFLYAFFILFIYFYSSPNSQIYNLTNNGHDFYFLYGLLKIKINFIILLLFR